MVVCEVTYIVYVGPYWSSGRMCIHVGPGIEATEDPKDRHRQLPIPGSMGHILHCPIECQQSCSLFHEQRNR